MKSKVLVILGVTALAIIALTIGTSFGFLEGTHLCGLNYPIHDGGWLSGLNPYINDFDRYRGAALLLAIYLLFKIGKDNIVISIIGLALLGGSALLILKVVIRKSTFWATDDSYLNLARQMYYFETAVIIILSAMIAVEIIGLVSRRIEKK